MKIFICILLLSNYLATRIPSLSRDLTTHTWTHQELGLRGSSQICDFFSFFYFLPPFLCVLLVSLSGSCMRDGWYLLSLVRTLFCFFNFTFSSKFSCLLFWLKIWAIHFCLEIFPLVEEIEKRGSFWRKGHFTIASNPLLLLSMELSLFPTPFQSLKHLRERCLHYESTLPVDHTVIQEAGEGCLSLTCSGSGFTWPDSQGSPSLHLPDVFNCRTETREGAITALWLISSVAVLDWYSISWFSIWCQIKLFLLSQNCIQQLQALFILVILALFRFTW